MPTRTIEKNAEIFSKKIKIPIGSDHAGLDMKEHIVVHLANMGYEAEDLGTYSKESCDYPDFIHKVAEKVENGSAQIGICICHSGQGANITANKHKGIRAALCWIPEVAKLARKHNNSNILTISAGFVSKLEVSLIVSAFLRTEFEGGRHQRRIDKIE